MDVQVSRRPGMAGSDPPPPPLNNEDRDTGHQFYEAVPGYKIYIVASRPVMVIVMV
jgi:hypothetical protein